LLHWGSQVETNALDLQQEQSVRIALSTAFADPSFEQEYFDCSAYLPFPPIGLRLGLIAGQQIQYEHMTRLEKHSVSFLRRLFASNKSFFRDVYFDKIMSACQFLLFQKNQGRS
jgi:hypothetical protein